MVIGTSEILELVSKAGAVACKYPKARVVASATSEPWYTPVMVCPCVRSHLPSTSGGDFSHAALFI